jgi:hypothetical protein
MFKRILMLLLLAVPAFAQNTQTGDLNTNTQDSVVDSNNPSTTNNYNGAGAASDVTPPPTAVAPGVPSGGSDSCLIGRSFNRRRDARLLKEQGMSIAAVARLCHSKETWIAMFDSGTPCPFSVNGKLIVGRAAFLMMKRDPETFIPDYKERQEYYDAILRTKDNEDEENSDASLSISERFRSTSRAVD